MIARTSPPMRLRTVTVKDRMQQGYVYALVEPDGRNFNPEFRPELTPAEMLKLGVFGGKYLTDCRDEFPASWFKGAKLSPELSISSAFTRASRSPFGGPKAGFIGTIHAAGFNGTAAISGAAGWRTMRARSGAGRQCVATFAKSSAPVKEATCSAAHASARRSYTGLMIAARSDSQQAGFLARTDLEGAQSTRRVATRGRERPLMPRYRPGDHVFFHFPCPDLLKLQFRTGLSLPSFQVVRVFQPMTTANRRIKSSVLSKPTRASCGSMN